MDEPKKLSPGLIALIVVVLVGVVASTAIVIATQSPKTTTDSSTSESTTTTSTDTAAYKDGTYSATGSYATPGGTESIDLTVTIKDGVITATTLDENGQSGDSKQYQARFASGYEDLVVGKNVNDVSLSRVAGSSLTSNGFNRALEQIKTDAAA